MRFSWKTGEKQFKVCEQFNRLTNPSISHNSSLLCCRIARRLFSIHAFRVGIIFWKSHKSLNQWWRNSSGKMEKRANLRELFYAFVSFGSFLYSFTSSSCSWFLKEQTLTVNWLRHSRQEDQCTLSVFLLIRMPSASETPSKFPSKSVPITSSFAKTVLDRKKTATIEKVFIIFDNSLTVILCV